jgi:hypothetical protein
MIQRTRLVFTILVFAAVLAPCLRADVQVKVIQSESDLPEKFCRLWKPGDLLVSDGTTHLLIGGTARPLLSPMNYPAPNALGSILGFVPAGRNLEGTLNIGSASFRIKTKTDWLTYATVTPGPKAADGSLAIECAGVFEKKDWGRAEVKTRYQVLDGQGKVVLTSVVKNIGPGELKDLSYSLAMSADHSYSFSPYSRQYFPKLNYRLYPRQGHYLAWFNPNPVEEGERRLPGTLKPGETFKVEYVLAVDRDPEALLRDLAKTAGLKTVDATVAFKSVEGRFLEVIVREFESGAVFFRTFLEDPFTAVVPLPEGHYTVRANFFPAVRERNFTIKAGADNLLVLENLASGTVRVKIRNGKGEAVPGKVTFLGLDPIKTPYFRPENPRDSGRSFEAVKDSVYPPEAGLEVKLPTGRYLAFASRGPEYTRDVRIVEVLKDDVQSLAFAIDKVIETPGLISLDPHLHTIASDGQMSAAERLRSIIAEGVDVAVATDHNFIIDYAEPLKRLGLQKYLAVLSGYELTKNAVLHANSFPARLLAGAPQNGAVPVESEDPATLFNLARAANPAAVLQINQPPSGDLGYFNNYELDKEAAATAKAGFDTSFTLYEGMNGPVFFRSNLEAIDDWLHLLNRGYFYPLVGSSDAHGIAESEPGYSRTYVTYAGGKGEAFDPAAFMLALTKGRSFVTNGPLVDFKLNAAATPGETITVKGGAVTVAVRVTSVPWVSVDEVRVIVNGERRFVLPVHADDKSLEKYRQSFSFTLERDAAVVIEVLGRRSLFPVVQKPAGDGLATNASLPYAITNPVFVDADGNGRFDPLWPEKVKVKTS